MHELSHFLRTRWQEILVLGIALQAMIAALFTANLLLIVLVFAGVLTLVVLSFVIAERVNRQNTRNRIGESIAFQVPRRGLIFTVGRQIETITLALDQQHPQFLGLICTDATEPQADGLIARYGFDAEHAHKRLVDPLSIDEIHRTCTTLLEWMQAQGLAKNDIAVDITGGLTTMSVGVFSAAEDVRIDSQYVISQYDVQNHPIPSAQRGVFVVHYPNEG